MHHADSQQNIGINTLLAGGDQQGYALIPGGGVKGEAIQRL
jgi:hypothetical protein